ncbi:uncharacterized protein isoform X1 [Castor canadensis]|uniref:Uncharacterized protein isoform X1 n=1 Tax=Castor canadensis TaxID=51338 RepID=A0AC58L0Z7_CASCN
MLIPEGSCPTPGRKSTVYFVFSSLLMVNRSLEHLAQIIALFTEALGTEPRALPMHRTTEQRRHSSTTPFLFCTFGSCKIWFKNRIRCLMDLENHQPLPSEFTHCSALRPCQPSVACSLLPCALVRRECILPREALKKNHAILKQKSQQLWEGFLQRKHLFSKRDGCCKMSPPVLVQLPFDILGPHSNHLSPPSTNTGVLPA